MEFVDGVGLDGVIKRSGKMAIERAAAIGAQVAEALDAAHKRGIVHRDIKPANIMIEPGDHVKVADFGIAKFDGLGRAPDGHRQPARDALLHEPGAGAGRRHRRPQRPVLASAASCTRCSPGSARSAATRSRRCCSRSSPRSRRRCASSIRPSPTRCCASSPRRSRRRPRRATRAAASWPTTCCAITRPGYVPTLRARETPTLPPDAPPGDVPTIQSPPTAQSPPTLTSADTAAKAPALAPTILTPATARTAPPPLPPPKKPPAAPAARTPQPPVAVPRRKGGGAGLIVGLGVAGLLLVAVVAGGAFFLMRGKTAAPAGPSTADATPLPSTPPPAPAEPSAQQPAEAAPLPGRPVSGALGRVRDTPGPGDRARQRARAHPAPPSRLRRPRSPRPLRRPNPSRPLLPSSRTSTSCRAKRATAALPAPPLARKLPPGRDERLRDHEALRRPWRCPARSHAAGAAGSGDAAVPQLGPGSLPSPEQPLRDPAASWPTRACWRSTWLSTPTASSARTTPSSVTVEPDGYRAEAIPRLPSGGPSSWTTPARSSFPTSGASVVRRAGLGEVGRDPVEQLLRLLAGPPG